MQVVAVSTPGIPAWRWRIVDYSGGMVEESRETFSSIAAAVASGAKTLAQMSVVDRPAPALPFRPNPPPRGR